MFSLNVKNIRKTQGLTQQKLAKILGVSRTTISAWENNVSEPDLLTLVKLKKILGVSYEDLLED
jgi:Predicted transcriptional regulators